MSGTNLDLVVRARRAVVDGTLRPCSVGVRAGRIAAVEAYGAGLDAAEIIDLAADEVLLPGLVDTHVHVNEPGRTEWEGFATATAAAAAGGVTTIVDMPLNSIPPTCDVSALEVKRKSAQGRCQVDVGFWGGAIPGNAADLRPLHEAGVFGFKCFLLPSGVDEFPPLDEAGLELAMREIAAFGGLLIVHAEDAGEIAEAPPGPGYAGFLRSRPPAAEQRAIETLLGAAARTGARVHVLHLSSAAALPAIGAARDQGVRVSVETCPHYLSFAAEEIPDGATWFKCCPPIRDAANRDALWRGLLAGQVDCVVSDHSPCTAELKTGDFAGAWGGIASLQLGLSAVWTAARPRGVPLAEVVGWMSARPAALAGLARKGALAVGRDADMCAFAPEASFVVDAAALRHRNAVSAYHGKADRSRAPYLAARPTSRRRWAGRAGRAASGEDGRAGATFQKNGRARKPASRKNGRARRPAARKDGIVNSDKTQWVDLASRSLGAGVIYANDELFADRENLIKPEDPVFQPHTFGNKGQVMDGWETRRRREPAGAGQGDSAIVRLGCAGVVRRVVVDTSYFTGNYPPEVSVAACGAEGYPSPAELAATQWSTLVPRSTVAGDARNEFDIAVEQRFSHVRLTIFPDGGVARLRVYGEPVPDPRLLPATIDLAALENGAVVTGCSNMFYSSPANLLMPGLARVMGDGWETARRRDQGNDWVAVRLACAGSVEVVELDTSHFVGNAPGWAMLGYDGGDLVARTALQPDTRHRFAVAGGPVAEQVRLDVYPDGGMARLRVFGIPTPRARAALADRFLRLLPEAQLAAVLGAAGLPPDEAAQKAESRGGVADLPPQAHERFRLRSE